MTASHVETEPRLLLGSARRFSPRCCGASSRRRSRHMSRQWDEAETFPRELYEKAAAARAAGLGFPEEYGGARTDRFIRHHRGEELARAGSGGVIASLKSHHRRAADRACRQRGAQGARAAGHHRRQEDIGAGDHRTGRRLGRGQARPSRGATAIITWSTARRSSSPPACAPIISPSRSAPARRGRGGIRCCWSSATRPVSRAAPEENGLVGVRYREAAFRRLPRTAPAT